MTIKLHPDCQKRMIEYLSGYLKTILVKNNKFVDLESCIGLRNIDNIAPKTGELNKMLVQYIDENPFSTFITDRICRLVYEFFPYEAKATKRSLCELEGYEEAGKFAKHLVEELCTLPWRYTLSLAFNKDLGKKFLTAFPHQGSSVYLNASTKLVRPDGALADAYPVVSGIEERDRRLFSGGLFGEVLPRDWDCENIYIIIERNGYIPMWGSSTPLEEAISDIKAIIGLGLAIRLFDLRRELGLVHGLGGINRRKILIHRHIESGWEVEEESEFSADASELIDRLDILDIEDEFLTRFIKDRLSLIQVAFAQPNRTHKIRLAAEWLFDSYVVKSDLLAFVQAMVAMEILLGEKAQSDLIGLGKLLANRCAYLIGKSYSQREEILKDFERIYNVRSKIVHQGKIRLNQEESRLFWQLRWMCQRAIQEELELLQREERSVNLS